MNINSTNHSVLMFAVMVSCKSLNITNRV